MHQYRFAHSFDCSLDFIKVGYC